MSSNDDDMFVLERLVDVERDFDFARGNHFVAVARNAEKLAGHRQIELADQIREENEASFENADRDDLCP